MYTYLLSLKANVFNKQFVEVVKLEALTRYIYLKKEKESFSLKLCTVSLNLRALLPFCMISTVSIAIGQSITPKGSMSLLVYHRHRLLHVNYIGAYVAYISRHQTEKNVKRKGE
jgi:hypothetical protein